jgi:hypothetical protein
VSEISKTRERLERAIRKRHRAASHSKARHFFAARVKRLRNRLEALLDSRLPRPQFNGHPANVNPRIRNIIRRANARGLYVTSTTDGSHAVNSHHYYGDAVDLAGDYDDMVSFQRTLADEPAGLLELFGPDNAACVKNGVRISIGEGTDLEQAHDNHDHVAAP